MTSRSCTSWWRRSRKSSGGRRARRRGCRKTPATRQSGAAKAEPARREQEDAARAVGIPSPLGGRSHPGSAGTEATAIAWTVAADHRHHDARGIHLGVGCVEELAPAPDVPATVTKNEKEPARRGRAWAHPQPPGRDRAMAGGAVSAADGEERKRLFGQR